MSNMAGEAGSRNENVRSFWAAGCQGAVAGWLWKEMMNGGWGPPDVGRALGVGMGCSACELGASVWAGAAATRSLQGARGTHAR